MMAPDDCKAQSGPSRTRSGANDSVRPVREPGVDRGVERLGINLQNHDLVGTDVASLPENQRLSRVDDPTPVLIVGLKKVVLRDEHLVAGRVLPISPEKSVEATGQSKRDRRPHAGHRPCRSTGHESATTAPRPRWNCTSRKSWEGCPSSSSWLWPDGAGPSRRAAAIAPTPFPFRLRWPGPACDFRPHAPAHLALPGRDRR